MEHVDEIGVPDAAPLAYDILTGLVGREFFDDQVDRALRRGWRTPTSVAVVLVGIGAVGTVVDRYGQRTADELVAAAAARLRTCIRDVDVAARIDVGVLAVLLESDRREVAPELMATEVAGRITSAFTEPLTTTVVSLAVDVRVGVALADTATLDAPELLQRADLALADAHVDPLSRFRFYDAEQQDAAVRRLRLKAALGEARAAGELSLRYQPLVSFQSGATVGLEALLRWSSPTLGAVSPSEFIPLAEESELIVPIGEWALRAALLQQAEWARAMPGLPVIGLSVNVSARQLARPGLLGTIRSAIADSGLPPEVLLLELTESALVVDDDVTRAQIAGLRDLGVRLALDDFGTGWSSLEYLSRLPVDVLKIAQVFVDQVGASNRANALVRAIIDLAHSLGLITVAEGVEREEQAARLRQMGCYLGQGWYFARELSADDAAAALGRLVRAPAAGDRAPGA